MRSEENDAVFARWQQLEELYHTALSLSDVERSTFVARTCAGDAGLQKELLSLLRADAVAGDFLQAPVCELACEVLAQDHTSQADPAETSHHTVDQLVDTTLDGRYEIRELIGTGGFGDVYRARDAKLNRLVVVKVLKETSLQVPWIVIKFQQEIEALTKIADPGVVGIFDAGKLLDGKPYLVMELVEGVNLRQLLKGERLALSEIAEIVRQVGRALSAAHDAGIIHRDLKPENIMIRRNVSGDLQVKVIDFGIAKVTYSDITSSSDRGLVAGTDNYMSPEQLLSKKVVPASDIFAFGIVAYEMVTGCRPFNPETRAQLHELQRAGVKVEPKSLRPALPAAAQRVILQALAYHPADRWQRARDFGDELARALTEDSEEASIEPVGLPALALEYPTLANDGPLSLRNASVRNLNVWQAHSRLLLVMAAVLVVGLLSVVGWYRFSNRSQSTTASTHRADIIASDVQTLTYWLMVKSDKTNQWVASTGTEAFFNGEPFHFVAKPEKPGSLYVFDRGKLANGSIAWVTLFPTQINHHGNSRLEANQETSTVEPNSFEGLAGKEEMAIIWADQPVDWLERIILESSQANSRYVVSENGQRRLQEFLDTTPQADSVIDEDKLQVNIKGRGEIIFSLRTLSHKPRPKQVKSRIDAGRYDENENHSVNDVSVGTVRCGFGFHQCAISGTNRAERASDHLST